jgi:PAS domain S-box-containing protein
MTTPRPNPTAGMSEAERLRLLVANVTDYAIYMLTPDGLIDSWNAGAQRFKGYTAGEIIGRHFSTFFRDEDRAAGLPGRALEAAARDGKFESEGWRVRKDGTHFWASVVIDAIRAADGELLGYAKITRDITERKHAQDALHASEEQFRLLVQGVTDYAIYMLSPTGEVTNWNAGARRIKGYANDEAVGSHFSRFYTEEDRAAGLPATTLHRAATEGRFEGEGWRVRKDGTRFWAHVVLDPIYSDMGELLGFAKVTRDITERRDAALTLERAQAALFQAQKFEAIGKLTGGIAHDFNNLLGVVVSGIELLSHGAPTPQQTKILDSMQRAASRGALLTQQLLAFARAQPLHPEKHNLNQVLGGFEAVLRRACASTIRFEMAQAADLPQVLVDATQFEAAVLNLVTNARDAMPDGGTLAIGTETVHLAQGQVGALAAGAYVRVTVRDTGAGMSAEVAAHAIDPFFTTKGPGEGTGLGLSQVYGFVQQTGGDLTIASEPGKGTAIAFYLPVAEGDAGEPAREAGAAERALIVDDQPDVLDMAVELFRMMGYEVLSANSGADALAILQRNDDIDVLFSDIVMPGVDGVTLARKARESRPAMKIILASGYPPPALTDGDTALRDFGFVSKPYRVAELMKLLRHAA